MNYLTVKSIEQIQNTLVLNHGERTLFLHPNTPQWVIDLNIQRIRNFNKQASKNFLLSITDRCNIRCDFCCHPYLDSEISNNDARRLTIEACSLPFDEISVTGGEPFLRKSLLLELAAICKAEKKLFGVITNGFWAKNRFKAFRFAKELIESGISRITFSWDPSHGDFVQAQTIQNGIDACMEAGMRVVLTGSFKKIGDCHVNYGISFSEYEKYANFSHFDFPIAGAGRGSELTDYERQSLDNNRSKNFHCPGRREQELVVYARDGLTQPCCSVYAGYNMPQLNIGNWREQSVSSLLDMQQGDPYYRVIVDAGFNFLYELLAQSSIADKLKPLESFSSPCEVCHYFMTETELSTEVKNACDTLLRNRIAQFVSENIKDLNRAFEGN